MNKEYLIQKHVEWTALADDIKKREEQMLNDLIAYHDLRVGDVVQADEKRIVITGFELRDTVHRFRNYTPVNGMPLLICEGLQITKNNTIHKARHEAAFNTSHDFVVIGWFDLGADAYKWSISTTKKMQPPRKRAA